MFDDLRDLYQDVILDRGRTPRHGSRLAAYDADARGDNPMCGDRVHVFLRRDNDGRIAETGFEARGCAISVASADLMAEAVAGRSADEVRALTASFRAMVQTGAAPDGADAALATLAPLTGVHEYPSRVKCAMLPWHAVEAALGGGKEASSE